MDKQRKLIDGTSVKELAEAKTLTVKTKCPEKWKLIDLETGEQYIGHATEGKNSWRRLERKLL